MSVEAPHHTNEITAGERRMARRRTSELMEEEHGIGNLEMGGLRAFKRARRRPRLSLLSWYVNRMRPQSIPSA